MDHDGNAYLHLASEGNQPKVCELLLIYDTEIITLLSKDDKTARDISDDKGCKDVLNVVNENYERAGISFLLFLFFFLNYPS